MIDGEIQKTEESSGIKKKSAVAAFTDLSELYMFERFSCYVQNSYLQKQKAELILADLPWGMHAMEMELIHTNQQHSGEIELERS